MDALTRRMASTSHTILITGRTGTGKSHLAREIHEASPRREGKFVTINLATLSENLIESELFGHEKERFRARIKSGLASWNRPTAAPRFSMKSASSRRACKRSSSKRSIATRSRPLDPTAK